MRYRPAPLPMHCCRGAWVRCAIVAIATAATVVAATGGARAGDEDDETIIKHGVQLRRENNDAGALAEFERAYRLKPTLARPGSDWVREDGAGTDRRRRG